MVNHNRTVCATYSCVPRLEVKFLCEGANNTAGGHLASLNWNIKSFESTHTLGCKIILTIAMLSNTFFFSFKRKSFYLAFHYLLSFPTPSIFSTPNLPLPCPSQFQFSVSVQLLHLRLYTEVGLFCFVFSGTEQSQESGVLLQ